MAGGTTGYHRGRIFMSTKDFIFYYIKHHKWKYLWGIITLFVVDITGLMIPQLTGSITDGLQTKSMSFENLMFGILKIFLCGLVIALGRFFWRYFLFGACRSIEFEIRNDLFKHLETLSLSYFNKNKTGDLMSHFTNDLSAVRMSVGPAVITTFDASIMTVMVLVKMITYVNLELTLLAIIPLLLIAILGGSYGKAEERRFSAKQQAFSRMTDKAQESISGVRVIKAFVQEQNELDAFSEVNKDNMFHNLRVVKLQAVVMPLLDVIIGASSLIALLYGGYLTLLGKISLGRFIAFMQYIGMLVWPMIATGESITIFSQGIASIRRIKKIFDEKPEIHDEDNLLEVSSLKGDIKINHLNFQYPDTMSNVKTSQLTSNDVKASQLMSLALKDITVHVKEGGTLAILGKTGSGKTSIVNLLLKLYNSSENSIFFDDNEINKIPLKVLRENISYVPQDNFLFSDTIKNNIAFGLEAVDQEKVEEAAKMACIHDNIIDFPGGYETVVGERGATLSGGQKQRCSIARALMKNAPILILDDALSAVDTDTEEKILKNLIISRRGRTTIIIAHRISTIQHADHIAVLEEGTLIEYGNHKDLLQSDGVYKKLYEKQQLEKQLIDEEE